MCSLLKNEYKTTDAGQPRYSIDVYFDDLQWDK